MDSFGTRLALRMAERGRLCVGIDPHPSLLAAWGLSDDPAGLRTFCRICQEAFARRVALVKPQVAFFERFGAAGYEVLEETIAQLRAGGALVVADAKRGDIGSTMEGYARAWLDPAAPLRVDALIVSPYLGVGSLAPAFDLAAQTGTGLFVLAATSNPEADALQHGVTEGGLTVSQRVVGEVARLGEERHAASSIGVVVGATLSDPPSLNGFRGPVLLPGVGAQGATIADVDRITEGAVGSVVPTVSRAILRAGPDEAGLVDAMVRFLPLSA